MGTAVLRVDRRGRLPARIRASFYALSADPAPLTYVIRVRNFVAPMSIGVYAHEHERPQRVRINVEMTVALPAGRIDDDIRHVPSYEAVMAGLRRLVAAKHVDLVETLADRILTLALAHPAVQSAGVEVEKLDVFPEAESVGVRFERRRPA
jgi:dihydroneopterin aldolase